MWIMHSKKSLEEEMLSSSDKKLLESDGDIELYSRGECYKIYQGPVRNIETSEIIETPIKLYKYRQVDGTYIYDEDVYEVIKND